MNSKQHISQLLGYAIQSQISHRCYCRKYNISPHKLSAKFSLLVKSSWSQISSQVWSYFYTLGSVSLHSPIPGLFSPLLLAPCLLFLHAWYLPMKVAFAPGGGSWAPVGMGKHKHPTDLTSFLFFYEVPHA